MNVTFEHPTIIFDNKIAEIIIEFVNHILYADSEETLRQPPPMAETKKDNQPRYNL